MPESRTPRRLIVALSGSTGPHYGVRLLEVLRTQTDVETHLILTAGARKTIEYEMRRDPEEVAALAHHIYDERNVGAAIASGTFVTEGMAVVPCSIKTLSAIATSHADTLTVRAADVCLKERRRVVLVVRETPLHAGHLKLMLAATEAGAVILPPVPGFYHRPATIQDVIDHTVVKVLDQFGIHLDLIERWRGLPDGQSPPQPVRPPAPNARAASKRP
jgi:polyprenyl P-hydroxybenzoate/phenylacrylic acid decarboxylase-like protein